MHAFAGGDDELAFALLEVVDEDAEALGVAGVLFDFSDRFDQLLGIHGLEQIIHGGKLDRFQGIGVMGRDEDDGAVPFGLIGRKTFQQVKAQLTGEVNVQK